MSKVQYIPQQEKINKNLKTDFSHYFPPKEIIKKFRNPTQEEITILKENLNSSTNDDWSNLFVTDIFDPKRIYSSRFAGNVVIGDLSHATLQYHDLILETGIYNSFIISSVIGNNACIRDVHYLSNYKIGDRVILFNIQEMSCTSHSKFGNGWIKEGEPEENRIWLEIGNENGNRKVLAFETMLPSDAYLWSRNRDDKKLMNKFVEFTENLNLKKCTTSGIVGNDAVIKNTSLIKDAKIGNCAYIKGAFKLKNITVLSTEEAPSQIGEGVEMINGIMGCGSKAFYQTVAVRFILGENCQIKYGARLLNTILGDNSTVSCCELLNNIIFPFHEQHHNTSFLIATTIQGQSNIAAGSTIGSNHNSRSPDGEIIAKRGFWPGLCSDFKHNCNFSSFTLIAKGSYPYELNVTYPFSLISIDGKDAPLNIMPAYWFQYNMFAVARNNSKFKKRDKRSHKKQFIETDPLAPDTMEEILIALERIITLTARYLKKHDAWFKNSDENMHQYAKDYLHKNPDADFTLSDDRCMKRYGSKIIKPARGYKEYRKVVKYFATKSILELCKKESIEKLSLEYIQKTKKIPLYTEWQNIGGQIIPIKKLKTLFEGIKDNSIKSWDEIHSFYDDCQKHYKEYKARYGLFLLEFLYSKPIEEFSSLIYEDIKQDVIAVSNYMYESSIASRQKDYDDFFRTITFKSKEEMTAVLGKIEDNSFLQSLKEETKDFNIQLGILFKNIS